MSVRIVKWSENKPSKVVGAFLQRPAFDTKAEDVAGKVLAEIQADGNKAVLKYAKEFDRVSLQARDLRVSSEEIKAAGKCVEADVKRAVRSIQRRVATFAKAGIRKDWSIASPKGGKLGERFVPFDRVGVYVPGGTAPLVSTVLMTVVLARVAGVPEIVVCTPCAGKKELDPNLLYAMEVAGATEVYRVGGIQAIGMMAYGTQTVANVQKIVGPGNAYVTAAKRRVYGDVALDLVAGPSEIAILADGTADARHVAADLLSQAEHGSGLEKALLVCTSVKLAEAVAVELERQAKLLSRQEIIKKVLKNGVLLVVTPSLEAGVELCNRFAPEHMEVMVKEPRRVLKKVKCAGAVFVGPWSPECAGDFVAGPSHVLPTGGAALCFSGLTIDDFQRRSSLIALTRADLQEMLPAIEAMGKVEGLDGHVNSARVRFEGNR